jgi:hypothetical protein
MAQGLIEGLDTVSRTVPNYVKYEVKPGGILEDVKNVIVGPKSDAGVDTPAIWIVKHPTVPWAEDKSRGKLSNINYLQTSFEFVCIEYDQDPEIASQKAENLATRVGASILVHFNTLKHNPEDPDRIFQFVNFNELIPDGRVNVDGSSESVPVAAIIFDFIYPINWLQCKKQ